MPGQQRRQWTRETPWRQGHVLDARATAALGLKNSVDEMATVVVVISHDCDLAIENLEVEPDVEVVVGRLVASANGNFTWAKAPRTLHLPMIRGGALVTVELVSTQKHLVPKGDLAGYEPESTFVLDGKGLGVLRSWLSARYNRSAFSDAFVDRMRDTKLDIKLANTLQPNGGLISFVNFDIDAGKVVERLAGDPYALSIVLVYAPGEDPDASAEAADKVVQAVEKTCENRLKSGTHIVLKSCMAISEDDLPVSKARVLMQWRLEHMTNKADDHPGTVPL
jgi:hypothetical protein